MTAPRHLHPVPTGEQAAWEASVSVWLVLGTLLPVVAIGVGLRWWFR